MLLDLKTIDKKKVGFFRFGRLNGQYLLTNDIGEYSFLEEKQFSSFLAGAIEQDCPDKHCELKTKGFMRNEMDFDGLTKEYSLRNRFLTQTTSLHIIVVTLRCDHHCVYCQAGSQGIKAKGLDMDMPTAQKVVDAIFESSSGSINIEFQGGEPLASFDVVRFIVEYARKKNKTIGKKLLISLVSNLTFMTQERLEFLIKNNVGICTSLDGPEVLHNKNRTSKSNSYKNTLKWVKKIKKAAESNKKYYHKVNALTTVTKMSLSYVCQIVDEFLNLGLEGVHLRPVNPFGVDKKVWKQISFSAKDFLSFYRTALDYIIELNLKGKVFYERTARIFLAKILTDTDPGFLDLRSPCGAGIGQLAYNFNGDVYTCDEARMVSRSGDESFRVGNVFKNKHQDFINNDVTKSLCIASCLDGLPGCSECVFKPYCGVCPVYNYVIEGNIFSKVSCSERCIVNMDILNYLFEKLKNPQIKDIFHNWVATGRRF